MHISRTGMLLFCRAFRGRPPRAAEGLFSQELETRNSLKNMEAAPGFEPGNNGFADRRLSHLAMPPRRVKYVVEVIIRLPADPHQS